MKPYNEIIQRDNEVKSLITAFKTIVNKQEISDSLAKKTVSDGLKNNSSVLKDFYGEDEPEFVTASCISFGMLHFMEEDFYIVKEVLGYNYILELLNNSKRYIKIIN